MEKLKINKRKQFRSMNKTNKLAFFTQNNFSVDNNFDIFPSLSQRSHPILCFSSMSFACGAMCCEDASSCVGF